MPQITHRALFGGMLWGIQLLYGYNHDEAIRSFEKAAEIDPSCAMAWWGSAYARGLHINNPEMGEEQSRLAYQAARKGLAALDEESRVEQALVRAVSERYDWPAPERRSHLDQRYADAMERVWHQFPEDADVGALFAESLMNLQPWDLWTATAAPKGRTMEIVAVLERTLARAPQHPGANHFYIHAIEASRWPERRTDAAERLQALVPGSGHLVHMPSHIFIRTGRHAEAEEVYLADLQRHPHNAWSLLGLQQAYEGQQKFAEAQSLTAQVEKAWSRADVRPVASCYCHPDAL